MDPSPHRTGKVPSFLLGVVDLGVAGILFLAPLVMGGRHPLGKLVFVSLVGLIGVAWCARQCMLSRARWTRSGAELLLFAGLGLVTLQILPLPQSLLLKLSPTISELLPLWNAETSGASGLDAWSQISLTPDATRGALAMYASYVILFLVLVQRIESLRDLERMVRWMALAAVAMAVLGLAQFLFGNGKFLWVYEALGRDTTGVVKGPFHNQNHFAHFLALGIGPLIWWLWRIRIDSKPETERPAGRSHRRRHRRSRSWRLADASWSSAILPIGLGLVVFAGLLTFSRGGVLAIITAMLVSIGCQGALGVLAKRTAATMASICAVLGIALLIFGYEPLTDRLSTIEQSQALEELSQGRQLLWEAHGQIIPEFLWTGTGIGSHRQIYPTYLDQHFDATFTYGESGFMQILVESGVPGLLLVVAGIFFGGWWCLRTTLSKSSRRRRRRRRRSRARSRSHSHSDRKLDHPAVRRKVLATALFGGLLASVVHSAVDFVWYIPACMSLTVVTLACLCRAAQLSRHVAGRHRHRSDWVPQPDDEAGGVVRPATGRPAGWTLPRPVWLAVTAAALFAAAAMIRVRLPAAWAAPSWERYQRLAQHWEEQQYDVEKDAESEPDGWLPPMVTALEETVRYDPHHAEAHSRLASLQLLRFDREQQRSGCRMPLFHIRDAVWASRFPSAKARAEWLETALGRNLQYLRKARTHALAATRLCPLQGEAYIHLGSLSFLGLTEPSIENEYLDQALRVRPYEGAVLIAAGKETLLAGDMTGAVRLWKKAFQQDARSRGQIIQALASQVPTDFFLDQFSPDLDGISELYSHYRQQQLDTKAREVGQKYVELIEERAENEIGEPAAGLWHQAFTVHRFLDHSAQALDCLRNAADEMPADLDLKRELAQQLLAGENFEEAILAIQWCVRRDPNDADMRELLSQAHHLRLSKAAILPVLEKR